MSCTWTLPKIPITATVLRPLPPRILVAGRRRYDLQALGWRVEGPPLFGQAEIVLRSPLAAGRDVRLEQAHRLPAIGEEVVLLPGDRQDSWRFPGIVVEHRTGIDDGERLVAVLKHRLGVLLDIHAIGRWVQTPAGPVDRSDLPLHFNTGPETLATPDVHETSSGRVTRRFTSAPEGTRWTFADALSYVIAVFVPESVDVPSREELLDLCGRRELLPARFEGRGLCSVLEELSARAGLVLRGSRSGRGLVIHKAGEGRTRQVRLQAPGGDFHPSTTNLWKAEIVTRTRPRKPGVLAIGQKKRFEVTLQLQPGWDPLDETSRWRDTSRELASPGARLESVYRRWVLNEHGAYSRPPLALDATDLSTISAEDFQEVKARRWLPCISCDALGRSLGVVVEVSTDGGSTYAPWPGRVRVSREQCAIFLDDPSLPADYFAAAVEGLVRVRVTGCLEGDLPLIWHEPGRDGDGVEILRDQEARWAAVHSSSIFSGEGAVGPTDQADDTGRLQDLAAACVADQSERSRSSLTLGWVDGGYHVGDIIERVEGRSLDLPSARGAGGRIVGVRHVCGDTQTTTLIVEQA